MADSVIEKQIEDQTAEELAKTIGSTQDALESPVVVVEENPVPSRKPAEEFSYTAADGTVYEAATSEDLFKKVADALNHNKTALKDREYQIHDLRKAVQKEPIDDKPAFDQSIYRRLMDTDALQAQEYLKQHDPDFQAIRQERERRAAADRINDEVTRFYSQVPDYAKVATEDVNLLMRDRLKEKERPYTAEALGMTYYELRMEGKIQEPAGGKPVTRKTPMPSSASGSASTVEPEPDLYNMKTKELHAYLKKQGIPGSEYLQ